MSSPAPASAPRRRGPIAAFFLFLWDALNFGRRLLLNLLFLLLILLLLAAMFGGGKVKPIAERSTLVFAPKGALVEQFTCDPLSRALAQMSESGGCRELRLRDALRVLERAGKDKQIERVVLDLDEFNPGGLASLRELGAAVAGLRKAGKQVLAHGEDFTQAQYLLAAQADEIYLDPMSQGGVTLEGLSAHRPYFREGLQDKLGVDVNLFKVGEYKSAAEPFVLDAASPESKEADLFWMNDLWQRHVAGIAGARKLDAAAINAAIAGYPEQVKAAGGDLAQVALRNRWVDGLKTRAEFDALVAQRGVADDNATGGFRQVSLDGYLQHLDGAAVPVDPRPQVAVVVAQGEIIPGKAPAGQVGGETVAGLLRKARDDEAVKAVVLRVNSPGGAVFASEQIRREVVALKQVGKPVVASMGDVAASGGYWISMDADRIYADESTITGSIGIFGMIPTFQRTLDKIGVHTDGVGTTPLAGAFDLSRQLNPAVASILQDTIEKGYRDFTGKVAAARGKPVEEIDAVARGRVWSGAQARERGLVDGFGGLQAAIDDAAKRAKLGEAKAWGTRYVEDTPSSPFARWFGGAGQARLAALLQRAGLAELVLATRLQEQAGVPLQWMATAASAGRARIQPLAHCLCEPAP